jgi:hypothetical protein
MKKWLSLVGFVIILFLALGNANAAIVDLPDQDNKGYFKDLSTGYTWMDVDNFLGLTYSGIEASILGTDFHIASNDEIQELFASAPLPAIMKSSTPPAFPATHISTFNEYYNIMGGSVWGGDPDNPTNTNYYRIIWGMYDPSNPFSYYTTGPGDYDPSNMGWIFSSWLSSTNTSSYALGAFVVNTASVPVPPALLLFGSGLIGIVGIRRKFKK